MAEEGLDSLLEAASLLDTIDRFHFLTISVLETDIVETKGEISILGGTTATRETLHTNHSLREGSTMKQTSETTASGSLATSKTGCFVRHSKPTRALECGQWGKQYTDKLIKCQDHFCD